MVLSKPRYDAVEQAFNEGLVAERKAGTPSVSFAEFMPEAGYTRVATTADALESDDFEYDEDEWDY